jgi:glycosyltransferase involved in cell wall biosynthesis
MRPFLSVVIPVYNRERFVGRCIDSVLRQDCTDAEIIAVDDGSRDNSVAVLRSYADNPRFHLIEHKENKGR